MMFARALVVLALAVLLTACKGGGGGEGCRTENGAPLASSPWPKFRRDVANTGRTDAQVIADPGDAPRWVFPPEDEPAFTEAITVSPVIDTAEFVSFVAERRDGSTQQQYYRLRVADRIEEGSFVIAGTANASGTPVLSANGRIVIATTDGLVREFDPDGLLRAQRQLGSAASASANIDREGTVYIAGFGASGVSGFLAICANGGLRFAPAIGSNPSAAAIVEDGPGDATGPDDVGDDLFVIGGADAIVHAYDIQGRQVWQFVASAAVEAAPIVDEAAGLIYVIDVNGRIFAVRIADGTRCTELREPSQLPGNGLCGPLGSSDKCVTASAAFGGGRLYVATLSGLVHAVEVTGLSASTCDVPPPGSMWRFPADDPSTEEAERVGNIRSSPALATGGEAPVIVFGADDGFVYAVTDEGSAGTALWTVAVDAAVGVSSPAIASDGSVFIGTEGGRLYAIGPPTPTVTPTATATPTP